MLIERDGKTIVSICMMIVVMSGSCLFAAGQGTTLGTSRYRVFSLKHISAEQGEKYLAELGIGTVSQLPGPNALLITGQAGELIKASAVLELVDAEESFRIKEISPASEVMEFPTNEQIAVEVGDISIGTFYEPPVSNARNKAIIDVSGDMIIAVASSRQLEKIVSAVTRLRTDETAEASKAEAETEIVLGIDIEAEEAAIKRAELELKKLDASFGFDSQADEEDEEPDVLFDRLIESIAETGKAEESESRAEKKAVEQAEHLSPLDVIAAVPQKESEARSSVGLTQAEKSVLQTEESQPAEQLEVEPDLIVAERLDKDTAGKPKAESEPESASTLSLPAPPLQRRGLYEPRPVAEGDEMLELDLPEKLNVIDLLDLVGKYLKLDYMYDETKVRGDVALRLQGPVKIKDLYPLLESVLKFRGFVMARKGNFVTIVPAGEALDIDPVLIDPNVSQLELGDVVVTRIFELNYIDTASAKNLLDGMKLGANVTPIEDAGMLIVTGYAYRMERVEKLLAMIDKPGEPKQFRFRQLKYTMAETLAPKIEELAEQLGTVSVTIAEPAPETDPRRTRTARARRAAARRRAATPEAAEGPSVYLDADERTNRILMIGLEDQLNAVENLIDSLDVEQQDFRTLRLYDIQYVGADEVVSKLKELGIIGGERETAGGGRISRPGPEEKR